MSQQISTLRQFAEACKDLDNDGIYELFEDEISEEMRELIYKVSEGIDTPEPVRCAFELIGSAFGVESLLNY